MPETIIPLQLSYQQQNFALTPLQFPQPFHLAQKKNIKPLLPDSLTSVRYNTNNSDQSH